jgi:hypothetical protein
MPCIRIIQGMEWDILENRLRIFQDGAIGKAVSGYLNIAYSGNISFICFIVFVSPAEINKIMHFNRARRR